jgi:hypothetical protein
MKLIESFFWPLVEMAPTPLGGRGKAGPCSETRRTTKPEPSIVSITLLRCRQGGVIYRSCAFGRFNFTIASLAAASSAALT